MKIFKIKQQLQKYFEDAPDKYQKSLQQNKEDLSKKIKERKKEGNISFDQAALDILLVKVVEMETYIDIIKDLWLFLELDK